MEKAIRVSILGLDYPLRVSEESEAAIRQTAAMVQERMLAFKRMYPNQSNMVSAVMTALAFADELQTAEKVSEELVAQIEQLDKKLEQELVAGEGNRP